MAENPIIPSDAVKAMQDSVKTEIIEVGDWTYVTRPVFDPPPSRVTEAFEVNTLSGLVDYIERGKDDFGNGLIVHVKSESKVEVVSNYWGRFKQRDQYACASVQDLFGHSGSSFAFGRFQKVEDFIIGVQAFFVDTDDRAALLKVVGSIKEETVKNTGDDGVSQMVTAKSGIHRVEDVQVPNPVVLRPFRTFREIEQPASPFVLRLQNGPTCALFEADGGIWRLTAIQAIKAYLTDNLEGVTVIG